MARFDLKAYARRGAGHRIDEIREELAALGGRDAVESDGRTRRRARRKMTAAERKAIADRMRKYWAQRRKGHKG